MFHWSAAHTVTGPVVAAQALSAKVKATTFTIARCSLEVGVILGRGATAMAGLKAFSVFQVPGSLLVKAHRKS